MGILRIERVEINDFRCFKNISFSLGKMITVVAGHNATGKSTILGLLGHCAEIKKKDGKPLLQNQFRTEFSEIIKTSTEFDTRSQNIYTVHLVEGDNPIEPLSFRTTWQNETRFRIIPKKTQNRNTEMKLDWPTLYLGLSRLYPIGESEQANTSNSRLTPEQKEKFFREYKNILNMNEDPIDCENITIQETTKKKTVGIRTEKYDPICNSAGQDNLSQILLAVMSFESLKRQRGNEWNGGLLLIDELDATLHPAAQNKLVKFLYDSAKELEIQIVFTTHSLSMLDFICGKCSFNTSDQMNNYEIVYLTNRNGLLELLPNPDYETIYYDMLNTISVMLPAETRKIPVYMEDDEARWLFTKLMGKYLGRLDIPKIKIGHDQLLKLLEGDYRYFKNTLFILDGDVQQHKIDNIARLFGSSLNILKLPGGKPPEEVFFDYLNNLPGDSRLYSQLASTGLSKRSLLEHGPESFKQFSEKREKNKFWFNQLIEIIERVYPYWAHDNKAMNDKFETDFVKAFNEIAPRINIPRLK
jgi:AAA15 family ATPase/GTPase